jgi:hypothetical protein
MLAPDAAPDEEALGRLIEEGVAPQKRSDMAAVVEQTVRFHPQEPHWYLPLIGVEPAGQGRGRGAAARRVGVVRRGGAARLSRIDQSAQPAPLRAARLRGRRGDCHRDLPADRADVASPQGCRERVQQVAHDLTRPGG